MFAIIQNYNLRFFILFLFNFNREFLNAGFRAGKILLHQEKNMSETKIDKREDVNPEEGESKYGDVKFADPTNNKYPIDTPERTRAAWNYINHKDNAAKYDADEVETIKNRIRRAAKKYGIEISKD